MIVLDANVLIALFDAADAHHAEAERLLLLEPCEPLAMSALTLTEFLIRPTAVGRQQSAETFIGNVGIVVAPVLDDDAPHLARLRAETGLKLPDVVVLWLAQSSSARLMTLDARLAEAADDAGIEAVR